MIELAEPDKPAASITPAHILAEAAADVPAAPGAPAAAAPAAPAAALDPHAEAVDLIEFANALLLPLYPSLKAVYTAEVRARLATVSAPLMAKYGMTLGGMGPEVGFLLAVVPLIQPTIAAIRADRGAAGHVATVLPVAAAAAVVEEPAGAKLTEQFPGLTADGKKKK